MKKDSSLLTTAQFARLHEVNRRTLHYYDQIGLFDPIQKGENGYRYYSLSQSLDFEYIRMLKELHMTIDEIQDYFNHPSAESFLALAEEKEQEIDLEIQRLQHMQKILKTRREQLLLCRHLPPQSIRIENCEEEALLLLPYDFSENDLSRIFSYVKSVWSLEQIRMGTGIFISSERLFSGNFHSYEGIFTPALDASSRDCFQRPAGRYLCGYQTGDPENMDDLYGAMIHYAKKHGVSLTGFAYELGLNEFAIASPEEYVTKIMIQILEA